MDLGRHSPKESRWGSQKLCAAEDFRDKKTNGRQVKRKFFAENAWYYKEVREGKEGVGKGIEKGLGKQTSEEGQASSFVLATLSFSGRSFQRFRMDFSATISQGKKSKWGSGQWGSHFHIDKRVISLSVLLAIPLLTPF